MVFPSLSNKITKVSNKTEQQSSSEISIANCLAVLHQLLQLVLKLITKYAGFANNVLSLTTFPSTSNMWVQFRLSVSRLSLYILCHRA